MGNNNMTKADIPLFLPGVVRIEKEGSLPTLIGGKCAQCGKWFFPKPHFCSECLNKVEEVSLGSTGCIYSSTVVRTKPPLGLPRPYGIAYVDLDGSGLRIFGLLDPQELDRCTIGAPVRLEVAPIGVNLMGEPCLRPYFTPAS